MERLVKLSWLVTHWVNMHWTNCTTIPNTCRTPVPSSKFYFPKYPLNKDPMDMNYTYIFKHYKYWVLQNYNLTSSNYISFDNWSHMNTFYEHSWAYLRYETWLYCYVHVSKLILEVIKLQNAINTLLWYRSTWDRYFAKCDGRMYNHVAWAYK